MTNSLRKKATSGALWSAFERFGHQVCIFIVQIVLARILAPEEFGLIALVAAIIVISSVLIDAGFGRAIIQKKELSSEDKSSVFYFNIILAVLLAGGLFLAAPVIGRFYGEPVLVPILNVLTLALVIGSFGLVHTALLNRDLRFKDLSKATLPSSIISGLIGIIMALQGYGVWALVGQALLGRLLQVLLVWYIYPWRPRHGFHWGCIAEMFPYGSRLALSSLLDQGFRNIYVLVIGKVFNPVDVGFFQRARSFQQLPVANFQSILNRVAFPMFSKFGDDPKGLRRLVSKALHVGTLFGFLSMALIAAVAEPMVVLLVGEKWLPTVALLRPLCLVGALFPLHSVNTNVLMSMGHSDYFLRLELIKKAFIIINILVTASIGVRAMVWGMLAVSILSLLVNTYYTKRLIGYGLLNQFLDVGRIMILGGVVYLGSAWAASLMTGYWLELMVGPLVGFVISWIGLRFMGPAIISEIISTLHTIPSGRRLAKLVFYGV